MSYLTKMLPTITFIAFILGFFIGGMLNAIHDNVLVTIAITVAITLLYYVSFVVIQKSKGTRTNEDNKDDESK